VRTLCGTAVSGLGGGIMPLGDPPNDPGGDFRMVPGEVSGRRRYELEWDESIMPGSSLGDGT